MKDFIEETQTGIYRISPKGEVYSQSKLKIPLVGKGMLFSGKFKEILKPEKALTKTLNNRGYYSVGVMRKTHMVHRLIAKAFIPNPLNKPFVNHKDGDKLNNYVDNLEWCTCAENNQHAVAVGLRTSQKGIPQNYLNKKTKKS